LESNPHLYSRGRLGQLYTTKLFWINIFEAFYVSTIVFYITYGAYQGLEAGVLEFGTTALSAHLAVMFLNLAVETKSWTYFHSAALLLSILFFYGFIFMYNSFCITCFDQNNPYWVIHETVASLDYWLIIFLVLVLALLPRYTIRALQNTIYPDDLTKALMGQRLKKYVKNGSRSHHPNTSGSHRGSTWSRATSQTSAIRSSSTIDASEMTAIIP